MQETRFIHIEEAIEVKDRGEIRFVLTDKTIKNLMLAVAIAGMITGRLGIPGEYQIFWNLFFFLADVFLEKLPTEKETIIRF